ncbi:hypothetical protein DL95DRAFT_459815 [Leptodontidium sp. 2 PMI_412]|nr:hypothetical protein DL95DRAFT_459815 [Leptodontidium sp. 2 PMI_412]
MLISAILDVCKQILSILKYIPYLLLRPVLSRVLSPQLLSGAMGIVLALLVFQALAEYMFFWAFNLTVSMIEKAFREAFNFIWWVLVAAFAVLVGLQVFMIVDTTETELMSGSKMAIPEGSI